MTDNAALIAAYFMGNPGKTVAERRAAVAQQFPDATLEEVQRGAKIAQELLEADAAEHFAKAEALRALVRRRMAGRQ